MNLKLSGDKLYYIFYSGFPGPSDFCEVKILKNFKKLKKKI